MWANGWGVVSCAFITEDIALQKLLKLIPSCGIVVGCRRVCKAQQGRTCQVKVGGQRDRVNELWCAPRATIICKTEIDFYFACMIRTDHRAGPGGFRPAGKSRRADQGHPASTHQPDTPVSGRGKPLVSECVAIPEGRKQRLMDSRRSMQASGY